MTIVKHKNQRVGIFIDTQNLYYSAKNLYKSKVNFSELVRGALAGRQLIRAIAYVITTDSEEEKSFFDALVKLGIETKTKNLQIFLGGAKKGDWDVGMAIDIVRLAPRLDAIVIVSGDGDFVPLVEYLKGTFSTQIEVIAFGKSASAKLKEAADDFIDLDKNIKKFLLR